MELSGLHCEQCELHQKSNPGMLLPLQLPLQHEKYAKEFHDTN